MPPSTELTTIENINQLIQPIAAINEIVKAKQHSFHIYEEESNCIMDEAIKGESSACVSPAQKRQKINYDNFPEINQTEISKMLLESIGKFIWVLYSKKLFLFQQK